MKYKEDKRLTKSQEKISSFICFDDIQIFAEKKVETLRKFLTNFCKKIEIEFGI